MFKIFNNYESYFENRGHVCPPWPNWLNHLFFPINLQKVIFTYDMTTFHKYRFDLFDPLSKFETFNNLQTKIYENKIQTLAVILGRNFGPLRDQKGHFMTPVSLSRIIWLLWWRSYFFCRNIWPWMTLRLTFKISFWKVDFQNFTLTLSQEPKFDTNILNLIKSLKIRCENLNLLFFCLRISGFINFWL